MGRACTFFSVLSRFYFRREQTPRFTAFWFQSQCAMHGRNIRVFRQVLGMITVSMENNVQTCSLEEASRRS